MFIVARGYPRPHLSMYHKGTKYTPLQQGNNGIRYFITA